MGKHRHKSKPGTKKLVQWSPDFNNPVCPTCGYADKLVDESTSTADDPMYECTRCWVRFMFEDSSVEQDDDDATAEANINSGVAARDFDTPPKLKCAICLGKGCEVCKPKKKKKNTTEYQTEPSFGEMEELTDAVARRSQYREV